MISEGHGLRDGMTLIEVMVAAALISLVGAALVSSGVAGLRMVEFLRVSAEARAMGKDRMEELTGGGRARLAEASYEALRTSTNSATLGHPVVRRVRVIWHDADGAVVATAEESSYAEVHVFMEYYEPIRRRTRVDVISGIVR